jgi:EpsD family peptidyl-prolyl cis-trans isomerase
MNARAAGSARRTVLVACAALAAGLVACGRGAHNGEKSQVVASVNGREITASQLNHTLQSNGANPLSTNQAVDMLVEEELLVQQAVDAKLDRDPAVVQAIEGARRQILARAYAERALFPKDATAPSESDKERYYKNNPALFEQRKIYHVLSYSVKTSDIGSAVRNELEQARSSNEVQEILQRRRIAFAVQQVDRAAEDVPMSMLPQFARAAVGDVMITPQSEDRSFLMVVTGLDPSPIGFDQASAAIDQFLTTEHKKQAVDDFLKRAKSTAKISYVGSPGRVADAGPPSGDHMSKGLSGLN